MDTLTVATVMQYGFSIALTNGLWRLIPPRWRRWADRTFILIAVVAQIWNAATYQTFPMPRPPLFHTP